MKRRSRIKYVRMAVLLMLITGLTLNQFNVIRANQENLESISDRKEIIKPEVILDESVQAIEENENVQAVDDEADVQIIDEDAVDEAIDETIENDGEVSQSDESFELDESNPNTIEAIEEDSNSSEVIAEEAMVEENQANVSVVSEVIKQKNPIEEPKLSYQKGDRINSVEDLLVALSLSSNGDVLELSNTFVSDSVTLPMPDHDVVIRGTQTKWNQGVLSFTGSGAGTITVENLTIDANPSTQTLIQVRHDSGTLMFENLIVENAKNGVMLFDTPSNAQTHVNNSYFGNNTGVNKGSVMVLNRQSHVVIDGSTFEGNLGSGAGYECGALASKSHEGRLEINNSVFSSNINQCLGTGVAGGGGGAISFHYLKGQVVINKSYFHNNKSNGSKTESKGTYDGGAIYVINGMSGASFTINESVFDSNVAYDDGGAIMFQGTGTPGFYTDIHNSLFVNNQGHGLDGSSNSGGAIQYFKSGSSSKFSNTITGSTFVGNKAGGPYSTVNQNGGAIGVSGSSVSAEVDVNSSLFLGNDVYNNLGEIDASSLYKDVSNNSDIDLVNNFMNVDANQGSKYTLESVFGSDSLDLYQNYGTDYVGYDKEVLPSLPVVPESLVENGSSTLLTGRDIRGFERFKDIGSLETTWIQYNANGGKMTIDPLSEYTGKTYYKQNLDSLINSYYSVGFVGYEDSIMSHTEFNMTNNIFEFKGWSLDESASSVDFYPGDSVYHNGENLRLYAVWEKVNDQYQLIYDGNGHTQGTVPIDAMKYTLGSTATVLDQGTLLREGYTFEGWNTQSDGKGTNYRVGDSFEMSGNSTLYAVWKEVPMQYQLTYVGNGNTQGTVPVDAMKYTLGTKAIVLDQGTLHREGYTFEGWNTQSDGKGTNYRVGDSFEMSGNSTLYAVWKEVPVQYQLTYVGNGNTQGTVPVDAMKYNLGSKATVLDQGTLLREGYTFAGWNTQSDGKGINYRVGDSFEMSGNSTLYAVWKEVPMQYQLTYVGNGNTKGTVPVDAMKYTLGSKATVLDQGTLLREGYTFAGWNTQSDGKGTNYRVGDSFEMSGNNTLYAVWSQNKVDIKEPQTDKEKLPNTGLSDHLNLGLMIIALGTVLVYYKRKRI